jgi:hypothetical protein
MPILLVVLALSGSAPGSVAAAADPNGRPDAGRLWEVFPLGSRAGSPGLQTTGSRRTPPARADRSRFEPPLPAPAGPAPADSSGRLYLIPLVIVLALAVLTAAVWGDFRVRRLARPRRSRPTIPARPLQGGIRYRE